ncbi:hypothetical protein [Plantactinospora sp. WMMB782]|uniref:hypothetical protein n=1 Tax=Plantactinospora sp. WMMB782 TaxID=3404121 RepID=UPI003B95A8FB
MSSWVRNLVMLVGLGTWVGVVVAYLFQGKLPDAAILGVPAFLVLALAPPLPNRSNQEPSAAAPPPATATAAEETTP